MGQAIAVGSTSIEGSFFYLPEASPDQDPNASRRDSRVARRRAHAAARTQQRGRNSTHAAARMITNLPNSTQLGVLLTVAPSYIQVRAVVCRNARGTDRHTDRQTAVTTIHFVWLYLMHCNKK